jgi:hypothetical protein
MFRFINTISLMFVLLANCNSGTVQAQSNEANAISVAPVTSSAVSGPDIPFVRSVSMNEPVFSFCRPGENRCGLIDISGRLVVRQVYEQIYVHPNIGGKGTQIEARTATGAGIFNLTGEWLVSPQYTYANPMKNGRARVRLGNRTGFVDTFGKTSIAFQDYYLIGEFDENVTGACKLQGICSIIDLDGKAINNTTYKLIGSFIDGVAIANAADNSAVYVDTHGEERFPGSINLEEFSGGLSRAVLKLETTQYIDRKWQVALDTKFMVAYGFSDGLAAVSRDGNKFGYIDSNGKTVIPPAFHFAESFHENLASVCLNRKFGVIDRIGRWKIKPRFADIDVFRSGIAVASAKGTVDEYCISTSDGEYGLIDTRGKWVVQPRYSSIDWKDGLYEAVENGTRTYFDRRGKKVANEAEFALEGE